MDYFYSWRKTNPKQYFVTNKYENNSQHKIFSKVEAIYILLK